MTSTARAPGDRASTTDTGVVPQRRGRRGHPALEAIWILGVWLAGALVFFREQWTSGFKWLMGNDGDTRLIAYLCEHWFRVFHGQGSWLNPTFFHPIKGVLGWADTFLLYEIFYAPLRLLGFDSFLALQITLILLSLVGFVTFVYLVRLAFGTPLPAALAFGLIFTFSNALWIHTGSTQLCGVYLVPAILLIGLFGWRAIGAGHRWRAAILGGTTGLLWALLLYSTYYIGWFATLGIGVAGVLLLLVGGRPLIRRAASGVRAAWVPIAWGLSGFALGLIPFLLTYLPVRHPTSYSDAMAYSESLRDLGNVGPGNVFWSHLLGPVLGTRLSIYEQSYAVTPFVIVLTLAGAAMAIWLIWSGRRSRCSLAGMTLALAGAAMVLAVLPLHSRFGTPWAMVWHLPGASAMRAIDRIQLITGLLAALALAAAARDASVLLGTWRRPSTWKLGALLLLGVAVVEQLNTSPTSFVNRVAQVNLVRAAKPPPVGCRTFFVVNSTGPLPYFEYQIDAMLVSQKLSVPTINGYTGYFPPGWGLLYPSAPTYTASVLDWATAHGLTAGLCRLDLATMRWSAGP
jgi:hypothetical protein